jgi:hypothetical protein
MTMTAADPYAARCAAAATAQGLDPVVDALTAAGIESVVEQTGGFTMVVTVRHDGGTIAITADGDDPATYLIGHYPGDTWDEGTDEEIEHAYDQPQAEIVSAAATRTATLTTLEV